MNNGSDVLGLSRTEADFFGDRAIPPRELSPILGGSEERTE
jgi:hypothetical protein